jgi:hypothetical protein
MKLERSWKLWLEQVVVVARTGGRLDTGDEARMI